MKKQTLRRLIRTLLFVAGGMAAGYLYYRFIGCDGSCAIASHPGRSMLYLGFVGWLLSLITTKENDSQCST